MWALDKPVMTQVDLSCFRDVIQVQELVRQGREFPARHVHEHIAETRLEINHALAGLTLKKRIPHRKQSLLACSFVGGRSSIRADQCLEGKGEGLLINAFALSRPYPLNVYWSYNCTVTTTRDWREKRVKE